MKREKLFELREDDRGFRVGDVLHLREIHLPGSDGDRQPLKERDTRCMSPAYPEGHEMSGWLYTGRDTLVSVRHKMGAGAGLSPGYCILSIERI